MNNYEDRAYNQAYDNYTNIIIMNYSLDILFFYITVTLIRLGTMNRQNVLLRTSMYFTAGRRIHFGI